MTRITPAEAEAGSTAFVVHKANGEARTITFFGPTSPTSRPPPMPADNDAGEMPRVLGRLGRYELRAELGRGATGVVYEAFDTHAGAVVALKTLVAASGENVFRLKHEFRSLANLEHENLVRFGELSTEGAAPFFTMERVVGTDFLTYVRAHDLGSQTWRVAPGARALVRHRLPFDDERLRAALAQLVEGLAVLHEAGRIHRDVKPSNVLVTAEGRVVLLDFGLMSGFGTTGGFFGTPAYMAPEQITGDDLGPAADWYALGVLLYASLAGSVPFHGDLHSVLRAKLEGEVEARWLEGAPEDLVSLCLALVQRDPQARPDVREIRSRLGLRSIVPMHEVFVGRQREMDALRDVFARAERGTQTVLVQGEAGMGKSLLVDRFLSELGIKAIVLRGRCYEQESVPFGGVDSLVDSLSEYLVRLPRAELDPLLAGGLSNVARVFPVLLRVPRIAAERIDGAVANPTTLRDQAFGELARTMSVLGHARTLVLFIDDLQWVTADSLALIRQVFLGKTARCLFVATMRAGSELTPELETLIADFQRIDVAPLSSDESLDLFQALAPLNGGIRGDVVREAGGHPLYLVELLRAARAGKLVHNANARLQDVLWERVSDRDSIERRFLEMAALAGAPTPYAVLAAAAGVDPGECSTRLAGLRAAQLVRLSRLDDDRCAEPYHDRVREAIMEHVRAPGEANVTRLHLALGRALLAATSESSLPSRVFAIVQHLNAGRAQIDSPTERHRLAELNLLAARQAQATTAFDRAREFAAIGIECLPVDPHAHDKDLYRDLHVELFTSEYMTVGRDSARATFEQVRARLTVPRDLAAVYAPWIDLETSNFPRLSLDAAREILETLGAPIPYPASKLDVLVAYARAHRARRRRTPEELEATAPLRDDATRMVLRVLVAAMPGAYFCDENLFPWILLRIAETSMRDGLGDESPIGFLGYGIIRSAAFGQHREGAAFGRAALRLARASHDARILAKVEFMHGVFLAPWVSPFAQVRAELEDAERVAVRCGDTQYQAYGRSQILESSLCRGVDLDQVTAEAEISADVAQRYTVKVHDHGHSYERYTASLRGTPSTDPLPPIDAATTDIALLRHYWLRAELRYLGGADAADIDGLLREIARRKHTAFALTISVEAEFLGALVAARGCTGASRLERARRIARVALAAYKLDAWARSCPANFEPYALLVQAELARVLGRRERATAAYDRAIASARANGTPKRTALACELAMHHALARGRASEAAQYRAFAVESYRQWGATVKAVALEEGTVEAAAKRRLDLDIG